MTKVTEQQLTALSRFGRNYAVNHLELTDSGENLAVKAELRAGSKLIEKAFVLSPNGSLVRSNNDESSEAKS